MYILCDLTGLPRAYAALTLAPFGYRSYYFQLFRNAQLAVQFRPQRVNDDLCSSAWVGDRPLQLIGAQDQRAQARDLP